MQKSLAKLSVLALALAWAAPAAAQDLSSFYVTPKIMMSYQKGEMSAGGQAGSGHERKSSFGFGLAAGTDLSYSSSLPLRVEAEYLYHGNHTFNNHPNSYDISAHSILFNGFFDFNTDTAFTPYLGGGLGLANIKNNSNVGGQASTDSRWGFAWDLGGGVAWSLNEKMALDLGYRYMDLGKCDNALLGPNASSLSLTAHEFSLGLRFSGF